MKSKVVLVTALLATGCFGKVSEEATVIVPETARETAGNPGVPSPVPGASGSTPSPGPSSTATPTSPPPAGSGDATGTCWQSFPDVPAATGPSGTPGGCSLVGTWTYEVDFSYSKNYRTVWAFDDQGRMVGGPEGTNLCQGFTWNGNYTLDADRFAVTRVSGVGAPTCGRDFVSSFPLAWSADCKTMTLPNVLRNDSCTGGGLFYSGRMTKIQ